jgi:hypothetical protein
MKIIEGPSDALLAKLPKHWTVDEWAAWWGKWGQSHGWPETKERERDGKARDSEPV